MKRSAWLFAGSVVIAAVPAFAQSASPTAGAEPGPEQVTAQTEPTVEAGVAEEEIIVTGIRGSLASSAQMKRNADLIVDSITAEDVGKFPDTNIAESLQRITGVAIDRSGGEGQFITVRGLGPEFNTVLVNGRVMATDNPGREFSFDVLSPNLIQRTDVFKSSVPQLQEGGIGATVNILTSRPLDGKRGFHAAVSAGGTYDRLRKKLGPDLSATASWTNDDKTVGVVLSGAYTDRHVQLDYVQTDGWIFGQQDIVNGAASASNLPAGSVTKTSQRVHVPQNLAYVQQREDRERLNLSGAFEVKLSDQLLFRVDGIYSKFNVNMQRNNFANFYSSPYIDLKVDSSGTANSFSRPGRDFRAANPALASLSLSQNDNIVERNDRFAETYQFGGNLKWTPSEDAEIVFDASKTRATQHNPRQFVVVGSLAQTSPLYTLGDDDGVPVASNYGVIDDPSLMRAHYAAVEDNRIKDDGSEYHVDSTFQVRDSLLSKVQIGFSYSDRHKTRRPANNYADGACTYCGYEVPIDPSLLSSFEFGKFLPGVAGADAAPSRFFTFDPGAILAFLSDPATLAIPRQGRSAAAQAAEAARLLALAGGPYGAREQLGGILDVREKLLAGYLSFTFAGDNWNGNVGVRVVETQTRSAGFIQPVTGITTTPGDDTLSYSYGPSTPISVSNRYVNALPSANFKLNVTPTVIARAAFSQTVTRPTLTDLGVDNSYGGRVSVPLSSGGNPGLRPFKSTNYDLSFEWYPSRTSYVSIGGFYKSLEDFLELTTEPVSRFDRIFQDTRTRNGQTGHICQRAPKIPQKWASKIP
ncbi:MAG: TonB-dependent receptor [Pseudomonadota bacterium]|nr:TonB-dependent receptor [Pseudomonadota bacterium]